MRRKPGQELCDRGLRSCRFREDMMTYLCDLIIRLNIVGHRTHDEFNFPSGDPFRVSESPELMRDVEALYRVRHKTLLEVLSTAQN